MRRAGWVLTTILAAAVMAACGGGGSDSSTVGTTTTTSSTASSSAAPSSSAASGLCALVTADEAAHLLGVAAMKGNNGQKECFYMDPAGSGSLLKVDVASGVDAATFTTNRGAKGTKVDGLGDAAFIQVFSTSPSSAAVFVLIGTTEIDITAQSAATTLDPTALEAAARTALSRH